MRISGDVKRYEENDTYGIYKQPGDLFRLMPQDEKERMFVTIATALDGVSEEIVQRQLAHFYKADPAYGKGVEDAIEANKTGVDPNSNVLPEEV